MESTHEKVKQYFSESVYEAAVALGKKLDLSAAEVGDALCWALAQFIADYLKPGHEEEILKGIGEEIARRRTITNTEGTA